MPVLYFCSRNEPAGTFYSPWQPFTDSTCPAVIIIHLSTSYILPPSYKNIHNTTSSKDTKRKPLCNTYDVRVRFIDLLNLNSLLTFLFSILCITSITEALSIQFFLNNHLTAIMNSVFFDNLLSFGHTNPSDFFPT